MGTIPLVFTWSTICGDHPEVMGVLNVTPDSFSDGGRFLAPAAAVDHGLELVAAGAGLVDVGGESTRPGARPVTEEEELRRVLPVVERLAASGVVVSIDTTKANVARAALDAGAVVVNDVSAGRFEPEILDVVAERGAGYVAMHMLGEPRSMQQDPRYGDVVDDVIRFLAERLEVARAAGIRDDALCVDPGIGFGKTSTHNLTLLARLDELGRALPVPIAIGTSRKTFLGAVLTDVAGAHGAPPPEQRDDATLATVVWALDHGASIVRVHDVAPAARAVALLGALKSAA
jgi:dihydropteroate synthase